MAKAKKRVNPSKILLKKPVDIEQLLKDMSKGNMYHAWLIIFPSLLRRQDATTESVLKDWEAANDYISELHGEKLNREIRRMANEIGKKLPYQNIDLSSIHTQADLETVKRKIGKNALQSAFCIAAIGLQYSDNYSKNDLQEIFFDADITLAEIEHGVLTYEELNEELKKQGIAL